MTGKLEPVSATGLASIDDAFSRLGSGNFGSAITNQTSHALPRSGTGVQIGTLSLWRKLTASSITDALTDEDTEDDAVERFPIPEPKWNPSGSKSAFRGPHGLDPSDPFKFSFSNLKAVATFKACPGRYVITYHLAKRPRTTDNSTAPWVPYTEVDKTPREGPEFVVEKTIPVPKGNDNYEYTINNITISGSGCNSQTAGDASHNLSSVHSSFSLGPLDAQGGAGTLAIHQEAINAASYLPSSLGYYGPNSPLVEVIRGSSIPLAIRQVKTPSILAHVNPLLAPLQGYEIEFYKANQVGAKNPETGLYARTGNPYVVQRIDNPDELSIPEAARLRITETRGSQVKSVIYAFDSANSTWSLTEGDGLRVTSIVTSTNAATGEVTKTTTLKDTLTPAETPEKQIASVTARTTRSFPWGPAPVSEVRDPAGAALTTSYTYYEDAATDGPNYSHLKSRQDPNGYWELYTYDATGRVTSVTSPHLTAAIGAPASACRVVTTDRTPLPDADGDTLPEPFTTTIETLLGVEISRTYEIEWTAPVTFGNGSCTRTTTVRTTGPGVAWNSPTQTLTTETLRHATGPFADRLRRELRPDGTATLVTYALDATSGELTTTTATGLPNTARDAITTGEQSVTVTNSFGQTISSDLVRIDATPANLLLESWLVTETDDFGRPERIDYTDGTYTTRTYACCGLSSERDRKGNTATYTYDDLGRRETQTSNGLTLKTTYDAASNVRKVIRYPAGTPASALTVSETDYDLAGRVTATRDPLNRETTIVETYSATTRETTTLQTLPSVSGQPTTIQTISAPDGRLIRRTGTAAAPVRYTYGITTLTGLATLTDTNALNYPAGTPFTTTQEIKLDAAGADTLEVTTTYTDPLGNPVKTLYAGTAAAATLSRYDTTGRLLRQTDPDGVQTLTSYSDALGTSTTTALDLISTGDTTRNGAIDLAGRDRVTRTTTSYTTRSGTPVRRTTTEIWKATDSATPTTISTTETTLDGLKTWQTTQGLPATQVVTPGENGARTEVATNADDTVQTRTYTAGRLTGETITHPTLGTLSTVTRDYDPHGRLWHIRASTGTTTYTYFDDGQIQTVTTPDPDTTRTGPGYDPQTTTYHDDDNDGLIDRVTLPDATETFTTYYPTGQVKRTWGSRTYPQAYTYDPQGRVKTLTTWQNFTTAANAAVTTWNYDPERGWLTSKVYPQVLGLSPQVSYDYWPSGRLKFRDAARTLPSTSTRLRTSYTYTDAGELFTITYNDTATAVPTPPVAHTYDRLGRLDTTTDAAGLLTRTYDPASLALKNETYTTAAASLNLLTGRAVTRTYDPATLRLDTLATGTGYALDYDYDPVGRLDIVRETSGYHLAKYAYKPNVGTVETVTIKRTGIERARHQRTTDNLGRVSQIQTTTGATTPVQRDYTYDDANQRTQIAHEDTRRWAYGYDDLGQVSSAQKRLADGTTPLPGYTFGYTFDDIGNRTATTVNARSATYAPNLLNQYDTRTVPGALDVRGEALPAATVTVDTQSTTRTGKDFYREVTATNTSAPVNASTAVAATASGQTINDIRTGFLPQTPESFAHDLDGNLTQDGRWDYTYDAENRLIQQETRTDVAQTLGLGRVRLTYAYDAQFRRIAKKVELWSPSTSTFILNSETKFLYDGWNLLTELVWNPATSNFILNASHIWGLDLSGTAQDSGGVGGLLWTSTPTNTFAPSADANGNIVAYINTATQAVSGRADYGAFGEIVMQTGVFATLPFGFSTKYLDSETGLNYYGFRYYNPSTGRWLSRDPIEEDGGLNLYGFVDNSPLDSIDPNGLWKLKFAYDRNFSVASRGYISMAARADIENGNGVLSVSVRGGVRFFLSEVVSSGPAGTLIGVFLQKRNISQEGRLGVGGATSVEFSCPRGQKNLYIQFTDARLSISAQAFVGYQGKQARALGQVSGGGEWDLLTGDTFLTGNVGIRLQVMRGGSWVGWEYSQSGKIPLPFKLPKVAVKKFSIKLPVSCDCMRDMDGAAALDQLFNFSP